MVIQIEWSLGLQFGAPVLLCAFTGCPIHMQLHGTPHVPFHQRKENCFVPPIDHGLFVPFTPPTAILVSIDVPPIGIIAPFIGDAPFSGQRL